MCKKNSKKSWNLLSGSQRKSSRQTRGNLLIPLLWGLGLKNLSIYQILHFYNYLVGKDDYSVENLRTFKTCKRLLECKFFHDGHVEDLQCCPLVNKAYSLFQYEAKPTSPQCGHDDYLAFWDRCDRIMLYRISGAALYIFIKFFLFDIGPFRRRWFFSTFISTFILFSVFRGFEMLRVLHNLLRHVNR